jgi:hypothetical protein
MGFKLTNPVFANGVDIEAQKRSGSSGILFIHFKII